MRRNRLFGCIPVVVLAALLVFSTGPVVGVDRSDGATWTYDVHTSVNVGPFVVFVDGNISYESREQRTIFVGAKEYNARVLSVQGDLSGKMEMFGEPYVNASASVNGFLFETADGAGIVKEEIEMLVDATVGSGYGSWVIQSMNRSVVTYAPPYLSKFDTGSDMLGKQWTERVVVNRTVTTWENGTEQDTVSSSSDSTYEVTVGLAAFNGGTPIGYFQCIMLTVVDENGDYEERWWSDDVHGYVQVDSYLGGTAVPYAYKTMVLVGYESGESESMLWVVLVGLGAAIAATAVLAIVLRRTRNPKNS